MWTMAEDTWSIEDSRVVYGLGRGDLRFFDIDERGRLCVTVGEQRVALKDILDTAEVRGSVSLRLPQLVMERARHLKNVFLKTMREVRYPGHLRLFYPIKASTSGTTIGAVLQADADYGLEVASLNELVRTVAIPGAAERSIICDGVKTEEYIQETARLIETGHRIVITLGSPGDVNVVLAHRNWPDSLRLMLRLRPLVRIRGHWVRSTGIGSKFGLGPSEVRDAILKLDENGMGALVTGVLVHPGSQISDVGDMREFARYGMRMFSLLRREGLPGLETLDLGGGIPIDYEGRHPTGEEDTASRYAQEVIAGILDAAASESMSTSLPDIAIEAGRYVVAPSRITLVAVREVRSVYPKTDGTSPSEAARERAGELIRAIRSVGDPVGLLRLWESAVHEDWWNQSDDIDDSADWAYISEVATREVRRRTFANPEFFSAICTSDPLRPDYIAIGEFSVFSDLVDHLLVGQYFPIVPLADLDRRPQTSIRLVDLTCDSDGEISAFSLKRHSERLYTGDGRPLTHDNPLVVEGIPIPDRQTLVGGHLAVLLTGAYQESTVVGQNLIPPLPEIIVRITQEGNIVCDWSGGRDEHFEEEGWQR